MTGLAYPDISPVIFSVGSFALRWYSMAYLLGILFGWWLVSVRVKKNNLPLSRTNLEDIAFIMTLGIILGGRIGYILFYGIEQYWKNPWEMFALWHGGMSFHGGIIGVIIALYYAAHKVNYPFLRLTDIIAPVVPMGIFFGRLANFANDELWGRVTDVAWAVRFPNGGYLPRHPSQIYEACLEGLLIFVVLNTMWCNQWCRSHKGFISAMFLLLYAACRAFVEQFREPDAQIGFILGSLTMGQILSVPAVLLGLYLLFRTFVLHKN